MTAATINCPVGDARSFGRRRDLAAWLGLTPRQATTGGKPRPLGISKRGNRYLWANLIRRHGGHGDVAAEADDVVEIQLFGEHLVELLIAEAAAGGNAYLDAGSS